MSALTQPYFPLWVKTFFTLSAWSASFLSLSIQADELDIIQGEREKAQMQYIQQAGKYKTPEERKAFRQQVLEPAEQHYETYQKKISTPPEPHVVKSADLDLSTAPRSTSPIFNRILPEGAAPRSKPGLPIESAAPSHQPNNNLNRSAPSTEGKVNLRPEYTLDGSNIPVEMQFNNKSRSEPATQTGESSPNTQTKSSKSSNRASPPTTSKDTKTIVDPRDMEKLLSPETSVH